MAEPAGSGLRAARRSGLTRPEPVTHPHGRNGHPKPPAPGTGPVDKPQNSQRQHTHARKQARRDENPKPPHPAFGRWIEA